MVMIWVAEVVFPCASVAVKVRESTLSPRDTPSSKSSEISMETDEHMSVATAASNGISSSQERVKSSGTLVKTGGVESTTVTVWVVWAELPQSSAATCTT